MKKVKIVGGVALLLAAMWAGFMIAMRTKFAPVQDVMRRFLRDVVNPEQLETAGEPGAYASVIKHHGRTSGTTYETPVVPVPTEDGFIIGLPYGESPDWYQNVMAEGTATLVHEGQTFELDRPQMVEGDEYNRYFPEKEQRTHKLFGVDQFLKMHKVELTESPKDVAAPV